MASAQSTVQRTETLSDLRAVRAILGDRDRWLQYMYARTRDDVAVVSGHPQAYRFCLTACIKHVSLHGDLHPLPWSGDALAQARYRAMFLAVRSTLAATQRIRLALEEYNDTSSHEDVLALLDQTIASLESGK